ncbi:hypothetical protein QQF64_028246 [Cirrhinus molitorella]|uniref:Uncharacterized protein n=1 Tax=Cirrhinus molitorella TaxID=172907 RepID=A0ABR3N623_9TELE
MRLSTKHFKAMEESCPSQYIHNSLKGNRRDNPTNENQQGSGLPDITTDPWLMASFESSEVTLIERESNRDV